MAITAKEKELAAVGISVAAGCKPCTDHHIAAVRKAGATDEEIKRAVADAVAVRGRATGLMKAYALAQLGQVGRDGGHGPLGDTDRVKELVSVGAAFAVNCTSSLRRHLAAAKTIGITDDEIRLILGLAAFIKGKGASHVDRIKAAIGRVPGPAASAA